MLNTKELFVKVQGDIYLCKALSEPSKVMGNMTNEAQ